MTVTLPDQRVSAILLVEDEPDVRRAVADALAPLARQILHAGTADEALELVRREQPDLIVLDLGLPDMSGIAVSRALRLLTTAPILVLSARQGELDKIALLTEGADDYVTKPFSLPELVARVRAQLRRARLPSLESTPRATVDGLELDFERGGAARGGQRIRLTRIEWRLLQTLAHHPGRTLTHQQLFDAVWARPYGNAQQYLRVHVTNLRRKVERDPAAPTLIVTEPGVGYRFEVPAE